MRQNDQTSRVEHWSLRFFSRVSPDEGKPPQVFKGPRKLAPTNLATFASGRFPAAGSRALFFESGKGGSRTQVHGSYPPTRAENSQLSAGLELCSTARLKPSSECSHGRGRGQGQNHLRLNTPRSFLSFVYIASSANLGHSLLMRLLPETKNARIVEASLFRVACGVQSL